MRGGALDFKLFAQCETNACLQCMMLYIIVRVACMYYHLLCNKPGRVFDLS